MANNPPSALTVGEWEKFDKGFKENAPVRYWITKTLPWMLLPIKWKFMRVSDWIRYRTYDRYHVIGTGLEPNYYDKDTQILHAPFNLLKDYVEVECAVVARCFTEDGQCGGFAERYIPFYRRLKYMTFRDAETGVKRLEWVATLDDPILPEFEQSPEHAQQAKEMLFLYNWWVNERPNRKGIEIPDFDNQGFDFLAALNENFDTEAPDYKKHVEALREDDAQEEEWYLEDTEMLMRLIRIRKHLWI